MEKQWFEKPVANLVDQEFLLEDEERKQQAQARQEEKKVRPTVTTDRVFTLAHAVLVMQAPLLDAHRSLAGTAQARRKMEQEGM